jgi:hypothetical protein
MIATILTTKCREAESPLLPARFSRQFSRQSVASDGVSNQSIPTVSRQKCRDSGAARRGDGDSRQISRHFGGINRTDAEQKVNPAEYPAILAEFAAPLSGHFPGHFVRLPQHHAA